MPQANLDWSLRTAIHERRLVAFVLYGKARLVEPHDYGLIGGESRLFCYQVGGDSRSGPPRGWRWAPLPEISQFHVLDKHFRGARPVPSGRHIKWDKLFASVSSKYSETHEA
jgi:hypothetical protein